ncbi:hypothetical protein BKA67DRAFT_119353 [Truncatella angustata]|uniref:Uncharacterized protein n=1 Tax=Truncatella angustata TaxID=152316 RepID=A0A9P8RJT9_9PEZI|nr:uncharacterized protein BKA67DRAFT_119353 [Truncatella angustata]KAH6645598.1 hypothetical protein BKA67DRAFT_119353 [Truncatella angustata]
MSLQMIPTWKRLEPTDGPQLGVPSCQPVKFRAAAPRAASERKPFASASSLQTMPPGSASSLQTMPPGSASSLQLMPSASASSLEMMPSGSASSLQVMDYSFPADVLSP